MILERSALSDSVTLSSVTTDKFKTGIISFTVSMPPERLFVPYSLMLTKMLERATESYPTRMALSRRLDELYAASVGIRTLNRGKNRFFTFTAEILDSKYCTGDTDVTKEACALLKELIFCPLLSDDGLFPEDAFEQEKRRAITALQSIKNNPASYASLRLSELIDRDDSQSLTLEECITATEQCDRVALTEFYKKTLTCRPIDVYYVGSLSHGQISEKVSSVLGDFCATKRDNVIPLCGNTAEREVALKDEVMPISQGRLAIGFLSDVCLGDDDYYAMLLFNEIFGGYASSKLFLNVREKRSLCYSCSSSYTSGTGNVSAKAGISPINREITEKAILAEFENIRRGKITKKELSSAKKSLINSTREINDSPFDIFDFYFCANSVGIDVSTDEYIQKFSLLTKEDVVRVANRVRLDCIYFLSGEKTDGEESYEE